MDVAITKMSSKGQVVIPAGMRVDIAEGDSLMLIRQDDTIIMKKTSTLKKNFDDDMRFAKKTEEAWKEYDKGKFTRSSAEEFFEEMKKW